MIIADEYYEAIREAIITMAAIADAEREQAQSEMELFAADEVKTAWIELLMEIDEAHSKSTEKNSVTNYRKVVS